MRQLGNLNRRVVDRRHRLVDSVGGGNRRKSADFIYLRGRSILIFHYIKARGVSFDIKCSIGRLFHGFHPVDRFRRDASFRMFLSHMLQHIRPKQGSEKNLNFLTNLDAQPRPHTLHLWGFTPLCVFM